jgi:hypothetical protein
VSTLTMPTIKRMDLVRSWIRNLYTEIRQETRKHPERFWAICILAIGVGFCTYIINSPYLALPRTTIKSPPHSAEPFTFTPVVPNHQAAPRAKPTKPHKVVESRRAAVPVAPSTAPAHPKPTPTPTPVASSTPKPSGSPTSPDTGLPNPCLATPPPAGCLDTTGGGTDKQPIDPAVPATLKEG